MTVASTCHAVGTAKAASAREPRPASGARPARPADRQDPVPQVRHAVDRITQMIRQMTHTRMLLSPDDRDLGD